MESGKLVHDAKNLSFSFISRGWGGTSYRFFGALSRTGLEKAAENGLVLAKLVRIPVPDPKIHRIPPVGILISIVSQ